MKNIYSSNEFTKKLLGLVSEPDFVKFLNILSEPNIFKIVGRAHFERWHSAFIAWLLDINGSHLIRDYVLRRFLYALLDNRTLKSKYFENNLLLLNIPIVDFYDINVIPNEFDSTEKSIKNVGRFDIFLSGKYIHNYKKVNGRINVIIELKIDSRTNSKQSIKYANWLYEKYPNDTNILIYILPDLLSSSKATVGDDRWFCIDYQFLNDKILLPVLENPNLNNATKPFLIQYIKNLKYRYNGIKMAITKEEKQLAINLYDKYKDVFDAIYDALEEAKVTDFTTSDITFRGKKIGKIAVRVNDKLFVGNSINDLFIQILKYLVDNNHLQNIDLPWGTGTSRYIISNEENPIHPNGRNFFIPVKYKIYSMETHMDRKRGMKVLDELCKKINLTFETVES